VSELLDEALADVDRGYALLPVDQHKRPARDLIRKTCGHYGWRPLARNPAGEDLVRAWLELDDQVGVGVICGEVSQLGVFDVDDESRAPELPVSAEVITRRGRHVYCSSSEPVKTQRFEWGELRGEGAYVVAPVSRAGGHEYRWRVSPDELALADLPRARARPLLTTYLRQQRCRARIRSTCRLDSDLGEVATSTSLRGSRVRASRLSNLERSEPAALQLAVALGAPESLRLGESFRCLLHPERQPSAALWRAEPGAHVLYHDFHAEPSWLTFAQVRARLAGRSRPLAPPEAMVWKLRLACEAELLEPFALELDCDRPPEHLQPAWDGFLELLSLRWTIEPGAPAPFSSGFASSWCGIPRRDAHLAVAELARRRLLLRRGFDAHGCPLWAAEGVRPTS
jgi:hypothetical protein